MLASRGINPLRRATSSMHDTMHLQLDYEYHEDCTANPNVALTLWKGVDSDTKCNKQTQNHATQRTNVRSPTIGPTTQTVHQAQSAMSY